MNIKHKIVKPLAERLPDFPESALKSTSKDINKAFHQKVFTLIVSS